MNLAPYLEFMLKLQGDCLVLQDNQIPKIQLLDREKAVGKKTLKTEYITTFIESLLDNSQKKELFENKTIRCNYTTSTGNFNILIKKSVDDYILKISPINEPVINHSEKNTQQIEIGIALLRMTLGIIILLAWYKNITSGFYSADNLTEFFNWLFDSERGNNSSLTFYKSILDKIIVPIADIFAIILLVLEFAIGLGLLFGLFTRFFGLLSMLLFFNFFLSHFGGHEWIWNYVLLFMTSLAVFLGRAGRKWGIDSKLLKWHGEPVYSILW